jgi:hypothetical protein
MKRYVVVAAALILMTVGLPGFGEVPLGEPGYVAGPATHGTASGDAVPNPENYGGASLTAVDYGTFGFSPLSDGQWTSFPSGWSQRSGGVNNGTCTNVHLPSGALLEGITTYTNDTDAVQNITYGLYAIDLSMSLGTNLLPFATTGTPGIERVFRPFAPPITINNDRRAYSLCVFHGALGATLQNAGATFWYRLQVSPAPGTATFPNDVPTSHPLFRFVEALAASGVTGGCGAGAFCPDAPLTRGQMAVFLSVALGMHFPN